MKKIKTNRNEVRKEINRMIEEMQKYPVGSAEYVRAAVALKSLSESKDKQKEIDWMQIVSMILGAGSMIFALTYGQTHVIDFKSGTVSKQALNLFNFKK